MHELWEGVQWVLGLEAEELTVWHMSLRAIVVYISALTMVQLGEKRFLGKSTAFDVILAIIFGSVVSRAITGSSSFFPTLGAGLVLIGLHWLFAAIAFRFSWFGTLIKGSPRLVVKDGEILWKAMRKSNLSENDLHSALRPQARVTDLDEIKEARLERSGEISVIKADGKPQVIDVQVSQGVQTVHIKLE